MMANHWIIVPVVLPAMLGAFLVLALRHDLWLQRVFGTAGMVALLAVALGNLAAASAGPPQVYLLGDWPVPFGILLVLDRLSALMVALQAGLALAVTVYAVATGWDSRGRHFHALMQFQMMGLSGAFLTGDAFNLFVFFEVLLIASYGLMIHGGGGARLKAGVQYVAFNLVGSTLFLIALATLYSVLGSLAMADIALRAASLPAGEGAMLRVAVVLLFLVFAVKGALLPLQFWLPGTYAAAPGPVAALFAVMTKVGAYAVIRFHLTVFPETTAAIGPMVETLLMPAALATLVLGALGVLGARTLGRAVAFAALASMGTLFTAVALGTPQATAAAIYYTLHSTLAAAVLFLAVDLVRDRRGGDGLDLAAPPIAQGGLIAAIFLAGAIAMAGMPPLSGFLGKLMILDAARGPVQGWVWSVVLATGFVTILGFARAGSLVFWKAHQTAADPAPHPAEPWAFAAVGLLLAGLVALTLLAGPAMDWIGATADELHARSPYLDAVRNARPVAQALPPEG